MSDNEKRKRGRRPHIRLAPDRLRKAIKISPYKQNHLGQLVLGENKDKDAAGQWVSKLLRGEVGVNEFQLERLSRILGVNEDWLLGAPVFMNDAEKQAFEDAQEKNKLADLRNTFDDFQKSPVFKLIENRIANYTVFKVKDKMEIDLSFKDNHEFGYAITTETLQMIELVCADLCCSMIKRNKERGTISFMSPNW